MPALRGLAARAVLVAALVAGLNVAVDPFDVYGTGLVEPLVLGTRQPKLTLYRARTPPPEIVVLGSSRAFTVDPAYIQEKTGRSAFNASVHAGTPRDFLAFARCMAAAGHFPATLVVALGVEQFKSAARPAEGRDPLAACGGSDGRPSWLEARPGFLTLDETWASLRVLGLQITGRPEALYSRIEPDGMLRPRTTQPLAEALTESLAQNWSPAALGGEALHPVPLEQLRELLEIARGQRTRVVVYLAPFHPRALERYRAGSHFESLNRQLLARLAAWSREYPVTAHDFTDIASVGGAPDGFTDASHPDAAGDRSIVDALLPELRR